jgi:ATP-dependent helicase/nuclease subunit A
MTKTPSLDPGSLADQPSRDVIVNDLDTTLLVEAAAGTGKTTSLVARMVNLIAQDKCAIDQLAAVTFTRKAAAELRDRFRLALEKAASGADQPARERLSKASHQLDRCFLGTIHSFCARLLRERPIEAGLDPSFSELEEDQDQRMRLAAWEEYLAVLLAAGDPLPAHLNELGIEVGQLESAFLRFADFPDVCNWPVEDVPIPNPLPLVEPLRRYAEHMDETVKTFAEDVEDDALKALYRKIPRMVRHANLEESAPVMRILEEFKELKDVVHKKWPDGKVQAIAELQKWNQFTVEYAQPAVEKWRHYCYGPCLRSLQGAAKVYSQRRHALGVLNFQDLLMKAADLLRDKPAIRDYFSQRFTHLLVDEFQDTDPIQAEVILYLTADSLNETRWQKCRPRPGSLFVVGDPKQSIYRFRRADIVTYNAVKRIIDAGGGRVVALTANFRSTTPIVDWINASLAGFFPRSDDAFSPAWRALEAVRRDDLDADATGVYQSMVPGSTADPAIEADATSIANIIRRALDGGLTIPRSPEEQARGITQAARPSDFLIIAYSKKYLNSYAAKLQDLGIPHQVTGGSILNDVPELSLLHICLRAIVRSDDPIALVSALRSELFGCSDVLLYQFKKAGGQFSFKGPLPRDILPEDLLAPLRDAFERLARYERWLSRLLLPAAVDKIVEDLGLFARVSLAPGGNVRAGSLAKALGLMRNAAGQGTGVAELLDFLRDLVEGKPIYDGISAISVAEPAVRIMNLHQAKGLEAPVVLLASPAGWWDPPVSMHIDRTGDFAQGYMEIREAPAGFAPGRLLACHPDWEGFSRREHEFRTAEENRLLYVAVTRAGVLLIISQREARNSDNPWQKLADNTSSRILPPVPQQASPVRSVVQLTRAEISNAYSQIESRWQAARRPTFQTQAMKRTALATAISAAPLADAVPEKHGSQFGSLVHVLLEARVRKPRADLGALARACANEQDLDLSLIDEAVALVMAVEASAIWKRSVAARRRLAEVPLQMPIAAASKASALPTVQSGVIDLVFEEEDGWVVVDYKTDGVSPAGLEQMVRYYQPQVRAYADAWESLTGQRVKEAGLYFTHLRSYRKI